MSFLALKRLEANRDAVGALNIGRLNGGSVNWIVAHPCS